MWEAEWNRGLRKRLEEERGERLARLEALELKMKILEAKTLEASDFARDQKRLNAIEFACDSVQHLLSKPYRTGFQSQWSIFRKFSLQDPLLEAATKSVPEEVSRHGVEGLPGLIELYHRLVPKVRQVAFVPADSESPARGSLYAHVLSWMLSYLTVQPSGYVSGNDVESIFARTEFWMGQGNLDMAAREMNSLQGWPRYIAYEWIVKARQYLEVEQAVDIINTQVNLKRVGAL